MRGGALPRSAMDSPKPEDLLAFAHRLADQAGTIVRSYFRTPVAVDIKPDASPVTIADREAEAAMRDDIAKRYPDHGILGEELGTLRADARYVWVLDPIDGTRSFITGKPLFGTLIALCDAGRPILGIIDQPIMRERWVGCRGEPTTLNGALANVRSCPELAKAALFTTGLEWYPPAELARFERLRAAVGMTQYSADCYAAGLLASGFVDLVVECSLKAYDYCALVPVIEGAGGVITDWQGRPLDLTSDGRILAAGDGALHGTARALLDS